jgi:isoamylase
VLNAAPEEIAFTLPKLPEYKTWQLVLNSAEAKQTVMRLPAASETKAPARTVLAFAGLL